jgi:hypothetical protein
VLVGRVRSGESETALFVNCAPVPVAAEPVVTGVELGRAADSVVLEPFGVAGVTYARAADDGGTALDPPAMVATDERRDARV